MNAYPGMFRIFPRIILIFTILLTGTIETLQADSPLTDDVITATVSEAPPDWAVMERHLIDTIERAVPYYMNRFVRPGGTLYGEGPWDDLYEMFFNWPELYAIGGNETLFSIALEEYNALTRHATAYEEKNIDYHHALYREYPRHDDWFHISEGMTLFYNLALGDPSIPENIERAKRFAGFYLNEDPESSGNFDPEHTLIPSISTGSQGPSENFGATYMLNYGHASLYPVVKNLEDGWDKNPERRKEIIGLYNDIVNHCDVPVNLSAASLMTNAYLYTGDEKYKRWVLSYVDAWMERIRQNGGILPDNIGRTGKIGEYRGGQWWGGFFGWTGRYSVHMIFSSLSVAAECAYLLSGDESYLELLRSQIDVLLMNGETTDREGQFLVPYKHGPDGWNSFRPVRIFDLAHLWHASMADEDWERIERVRNGHKFYPLAYSGSWGQNMHDTLDTRTYKPGKPFDWNFVPVEGDRNIDFPTEYPRLMYYAGENPGWPYNILAADYQQVLKRLDFMRTDTRDIEDIQGDDLYKNNPVITKGLVQVTMGTPQSIYNGGLLRARVRYFDADMKRPGLPEDVAAFVKGLSSDQTTVHLVNLNLMETRRLIMQAGAFGEHEFGKVSWNSKNDTVSETSESIRVDSKYATVILPPGKSIMLNMETRRFVNSPSYAFPWHQSK